MEVNNKKNIYRSIKDEALSTSDLVGGLDNHLDSGYFLVEINNSDRLELGLPLEECEHEHHAKAHLFVTDSLSEHNLFKNRVIGQTLVLTQCGDGKTAIYNRSYSLVGDNYEWSVWSKVQNNVHVGKVTSLDSFTGNGVYCGTYIMDSSYEDFFLTVIDNGRTAKDNKKVRSISQFKYSLNLDGTFSYKVRTGQDNNTICWGNWVDIGAADTTDIQDGSITAQKLSSDIRTNAESPLRPLFIAAGAEYNDTGVDISKTAPWGETVTHKAGHYYLNGLGDITEEQMRMIYNAGRIVSTTPVAQYRNSSIRTNIVSALSGTEGQPLNLYYTCSGNYMEVFNNTKNTETSVVSMHATFAYSSRLKYIIPTIVVSETKTSNDVTNTFTGCKALVLCKLKRLRYSFSFKDCPLISKESVQYIIDYSASTSAITISLHPDAYARLADDADIVAALEAQPLVSLVSA